jgi:hypothetical protein
MKKTLSVFAALFLTACGSPMQTQPYNPYMMNPMGAYSQGTVYQSAAYQQNIYQQPGNYSYTPPNQFASAPQAQNNTYTNPNNLTAPKTAAITAPTKTTAPKTPSAPTKSTATPVTPKNSTSTTLSVTQNLLQKSKARFEQLQNFRATADVFEFHPDKGPVKAKLKVLFQKPGNCRMEVVEHTNSLHKGVKLTYKSGVNSVTGRPGGALSFMKMTLPMNDNKLTTRRGYRLDQVDTLAIVSRLIRPELNPKLLGKTTVNGRSVAVLEYQASNHFDSKVTKELLGIDMETHFVRIHEMYVGEELVYSLKLPEVEFDQNISATDMEV